MIGKAEDNFFSTGLHGRFEMCLPQPAAFSNSNTPITHAPAPVGCIPIRHLIQDMRCGDASQNARL